MIVLMNDVDLRNFVDFNLPRSGRPTVIQTKISGPLWRLTHHKRCVGWRKNWASGSQVLLDGLKRIGQKAPFERSTDIVTFR